jgi:protein gp37
MAENSKIEWTDHTFNPWVGCTKVSPGCDHCYAETRMDTRLHRVQWGAGQPRSRTKTWGDPKKWNGAHEAFYAQHGRRQRVFCASLADVFDNEAPTIWRVELLALIAACENLDWLLLTKRIGNAKRLIEDAAHEARERGMPAVATGLFGWLNGDAPSNVWLGATVVNQEEADRDIPKLLATPAAVRFLSMEPLLGPVELADNWLYGAGTDEPRLDWVIVGGESGPGARPMHPDWPRGLRDQCEAAGVPFLFKQVGSAVPVETDVDCDHGATVYPLDDSLELPGERHRVHTAANGQLFVRIDKKAAGRLLDGVTHDGFPGSTAASGVLASGKTSDGGQP